MASRFLRNFVLEQRTAVEEYIERLSVRGLFRNPADSSAQDPNGDSNQKDLNAYYEWLLVELQKLFFWTDPIKSGLSFVIFSFVYLRFFVYCQISFMAVACVSAFVYTFSKMWFLHVWPAIRVELPVDRDTDRWAMIDENVYSLSEIRTMFQSFTRNAKELLSLLCEIRSHVPYVFYSASIAVFSALFYLTLMVPSSMLVYVILAKSFLLSGLLVRVMSWGTAQQIAAFIDDSLRSTLPPSSPFSIQSRRWHSPASRPSTSGPSPQFQAPEPSQPTVSTSDLKDSTFPTSASSFAFLSSLPSLPSLPAQASLPAAFSLMPLTPLPASFDSSSSPSCPVANEEKEVEKESEKEEERQVEEVEEEEEVTEEGKGEVDKEEEEEEEETETKVEAKAEVDEESEEECLVKSNYCENFFTLDRQLSLRSDKCKAAEENEQESAERTKKSVEEVSKPEVSESFDKEEVATIEAGSAALDDSFGDDFEIISDSEIESFTKSKRHF